MSQETSPNQTPETTTTPPANEPVTTTTEVTPPPEQNQDDGLLFKAKPEVKEGEVKTDDKKVDDKPVVKTSAEQKQYLLDKKVDPKTLEGKTDDEIKKLFDEQETKDKAEADAGPKVDFEKLNVPTDQKITPENMDWVKKYVTDNKLTQEQAQTLIDKGVDMQKQNLTFWNETKASWRSEVQNDPVIGGKNLEGTVANVEGLISKFGANPSFGGSPELVKSLQDDLQLLGLGNKRSFIMLMNNIAKATSDDRSDGASGQGGGGKKDLASRMYPNMKSEG